MSKQTTTSRKGHQGVNRLTRTCHSRWKKHRTKYQYDVENRLTNFNSGQVVIVYDADGDRVEKITSTATNLYLVDTRNPSGYAQVLEEFTVSGGTTNLSKAYTYGLDLISQRVPSSSTNFFGYDGHGSTRLLTDKGGNIANAFTYDAYGTLIASNSAPQTAYLYCAQQYDTDLGLYYNRARYLNPNTGRFWTMDTDEGDNEDPLSLHKYLYGGDNPVNRIDPSGNDDIGDVLGAMDISAGLDAMPNIVTLQGTLSSSGLEAGPDVTVSLKRTLDDMDRTFNLWPDSIAKPACKKMLNEDGGALGLWDIMQLKDIGADKENKFGWGRTITFTGEAYYSSAANYAMWGKMFSLAHKRYGLPWCLATANAEAIYYKEKYQAGMNDEGQEALWFTRYGYDGSMPPHISFTGRIPNSTPIGKYEGQSGQFSSWKWLPNYTFDWKWLPGKNF